MTIGWDELGRGLVAGMLERQVRDRSSMTRRVGVAFMAIGAVTAIGWGGALRGLGITLVLIGLILVLLVALVRAMAVGAINKFATPTTIAEKRDVIDHALERADLPAGPISVIRFLVRLRRGVGSEVERLDAVLDDLREELAVSEDLAQLTEAESAGELDRGPTPDPPE